MKASKVVIYVQAGANLHLYPCGKPESGPSLADIAAQITTQGVTMNAALQALNDKLAAFGAKLAAYVQSIKDASAAKDVTIADLTSKVAAGKITEQEFTDGVAAANAQLDTDIELIPVPTVPVVPGALPKSFADRDAFDTALAAYTGPEMVNLDTNTLKDGTLPPLEYTTQGDGTITRP